MRSPGGLSPLGRSPPVVLHELAFPGTMTVMTSYHDKRRRPPGRVGAPVQVYLDAGDRERLERLAAQLDATKSEVLRRGLSALDAASRRAAPTRAPAPPLPTFTGQGLQPGVDLDDTAAVRDLMDAADAAG